MILSWAAKTEPPSQCSPLALDQDTPFGRNMFRQRDKKVSHLSQNVDDAVTEAEFLLTFEGRNSAIPNFQSFEINTSTGVAAGDTFL